MLGDKTNASDSYTITFDNPIKAFGWDYNSMQGEGLNIEGNALSLPTAGDSAGTSSFFGVVNTDSDTFTTISLTGDDSAFGMDNYVYASVPFEFSPTFGLLVVGGVFGLNYLRKKTAVSKFDS